MRGSRRPGRLTGGAAFFPSPAAGAAWGTFVTDIRPCIAWEFSTAEAPARLSSDAASLRTESSRDFALSMASRSFSISWKERRFTGTLRRASSSTTRYAVYGVTIPKSRESRVTSSFSSADSPCRRISSRSQPTRRVAHRRGTYESPVACAGKLTSAANSFCFPLNVPGDLRRRRPRPGVAPEHDQHVAVEEVREASTGGAA